MKRQALDRILADRAAGQPAALVTELGSGAQALVHPNDRSGELELDAETLAAVRRQLREDRSGTIAAGARQLFVQCFNPPLRLVIVGAVHIAQSLAPMAALTGYAVTVIDPRRAFATDARFPEFTLVGDWPDEAMTALKPDTRTAVVTLTHDPKLDDPALQVALRSDAFYIGALGSRKTHAARCARLTEAGFGEADLARIHGPAGLAIGAKSPAEIAISVMAEITAARYGAPLGARIPGGGMIFAELPASEAAGAILAHSVRVKGSVFKKGRVLSVDDVAALGVAGVASVTAARIEPGDLGEDEAARRIAAAAAGDNVDVAAPFTGRCNLIAKSAGVLVIDRERIDRLNLVDEAVTLATLPAYDLVEPKQMVATIKIIPFAVSGVVVEQCLAVLRDGTPLVRVAPLRPRTVGLIQTRLPGMKESILDKTTEVINARLAALGCPPAVERRCDHDEAALAVEIRALADQGIALVMVVGASAITDRRDVIPAALEAAGGTVEHLGMPVDPGNLLLLGRRGEAHVLGLPGCARSPKQNGFDWVLQRIIADVPVTGRDIMLMGAGGLLKEIATRPQPREGAGTAPRAKAQRAPTIAAVVLAAGKSSRMRGANKLLSEVDGTAMVVRAVDTVLASKARPAVVVTGNEAERVSALLAGKPVTLVHNPDYAEGISASLKRGLAALPPEVDGALICLADMPRIAPATLDRLIAAFNLVEGRAICVPTWNGKRGNPVLWARRFFPEMAELAGDVGARHLIGEHADLVCEVAMPDDSILTDIDTPEALAALRAQQQPAE